MEKCPQCSANGDICSEHFHTMLFWELDQELWDMHHLMVLSYKLQHPSTYSPSALSQAQQYLVDFLENDISPQDMREKISQSVDSGTRTYKITATAKSYGQYEHPIQWSMTCEDVTAAIENYYASVEKWARSVLDDLRQSGNLE